MLLSSIFSYDAEVFNVGKRLTKEEPYYVKNINLVSILTKVFILTFVDMGTYTRKRMLLLVESILMLGQVVISSMLCIS